MTQLFQSLRNLYLTSRDNCASGFIVVLLTRAVNGTSLKNHSIDKWIMKIWHIYTIKFYSARNKNGLMEFAS